MIKNSILKIIRWNLCSVRYIWIKKFSLFKLLVELKSTVQSISSPDEEFLKDNILGEI